MEKNCRNCKKVFKTDNKGQIYCNQKCRCAFNWAITSNKKKQNSKVNEKYFNWNDYKNMI